MWGDCEVSGCRPVEENNAQADDEEADDNASHCNGHNRNNCMVWMCVWMLYLGS